jgi:aliphatic nitrilase
MRDVLRGGCMTTIIGPDGAHVVPPLTQGEGILVADLDLSMIVQRKRMMDIVGHFARPDVFSLNIHHGERHPVQVNAEQGKAGIEPAVRAPASPGKAKAARKPSSAGK